MAKKTVDIWWENGDLFVETIDGEVWKYEGAFVTKTHQDYDNSNHIVTEQEIKYEQRTTSKTVW